MGVDCTVKLPHTARIADVADVIGVLAGLPATIEPLTSDGVALRVTGISAKPGTMPECPVIEWTDLDGEPRHCLFHYEFEDGTRGLYVRSTPFWCAVAVKLVNLFGGSVDFADCDDMGIDYQSGGNPLQTATDGDDWNNWQLAMYSVAKLTKADIQEGRKVCAYPEQKWRKW